MDCAARLKRQLTLEAIVYCQAISTQVGLPKAYASAGVFMPCAW